VYARMLPRTRLLNSYRRARAMVEIFMESSIQDPEALLAADVDGKSIDLSLLAQIERDLVYAWLFSF